MVASSPHPSVTLSSYVPRALVLASCSLFTGLFFLTFVDTLQTVRYLVSLSDFSTCTILTTGKPTKPLPRVPIVTESLYVLWLCSLPSGARMLEKS